MSFISFGSSGASVETTVKRLFSITSQSVHVFRVQDTPSPPDIETQSISSQHMLFSAHCQMINPSDTPAVAALTHKEWVPHPNQSFEHFFNILKILTESSAVFDNVLAPGGEMSIELWERAHISLTAFPLP